MVKILLIDDDQAIGELFSYALKKSGLDTILALDGKSGIYKAKIETDSEEYKLIDIKVPQDLTPELKGKIQEIAIKVYEVLGASDYARMDIRMNTEGKLYVLEANLNPYLAQNSETAIAAEASGLSYEHLIGGLVEEALSRASSKI